MIGEIRTQDINTIIKPLFDSIDACDLWALMYDCGFNNMVTVHDDGIANSIKLYGFVGEFI